MKCIHCGHAMEMYNGKNVCMLHGTKAQQEAHPVWQPRKTKKKITKRK